MRRFVRLGLLLVAGVCAAGLTSEWKPARAARASAVTLARVPEGGLQPQVAAGPDAVHLIYFKGEASGGDVFYAKSTSGGTFGSAVRVNTQPGSAIATGTVRGAQLALGRNGRVHVAWMGSAHATPRGPADAAPMLYTRLADSGAAFERERNVLQYAVGLDGGGSVAADAAGNVYVVWHAGGPDARDEGERRVWVSRSADDGRTFSREQAASPISTGACGCCGARAMADRDGGLVVLYRGAAELVHRDTYLLSSSDRGRSFKTDKLEEWNVGACPMSTFSLGDGPAGPVAAWETAGQVNMVRIDRASRRRSAVMTPATEGTPSRKHPAVATNATGETILVWTEGTGWQRGGSVAWQVFDARGVPTSERGRMPGVPMWSLAAVYARPDGGFTILY